MITQADAVAGGRFHENHEPGGKIYTWRSNGACKTWKTRPGEFRLPVKYGLRSYDYITHLNAAMFHREDQCPSEVRI